MRQWLGIALLVVIFIAILNMVWFVRRKQDDSQFRTTLASYRATLRPGTSRERVEQYLRQKNMPYERSCCQAGVFSDLAKLGTESPSIFCHNLNIYLEFHFNSADAPQGSDALTRIDLYQRGTCL